MGFLYRHRLLILAVALGAALVVAAVQLLVIPATYEAAAMFVVAPPRFHSELKPAPLSVHGYQRLLESDTVLAEATQALIDDGVLQEGESLRLGQEVRSRIFVSRRSETTALAPVLEATAEAPEPQAAAEIANTWGRVFLEHLDRLARSSVDPAWELISAELQRAREELERLELRQTELSAEYQERIDELESSWDRRLVSHKKATEDLLAAYQTATRRRIEALASELYAKLPEERAPGEEPGPSPTSPSRRLRVQLEQIVSLRTQLAQTPLKLTLEKAISDDALWEAILRQGSASANLPEGLPAGLRTQEINPVHTALALKLSSVELALEPLSPALRREVRSLAGEIETVQRERSAGLSKLIAERGQELEELKRKREQELADLRRERSMVLGQLRREVAHQRSLFNTLAANRDQAKIARAERDVGDVHLASPAVPPRRPESSRTVLKALLAFVLGGTIGLGIALFREVEPG